MPELSTEQMLDRVEELKPWRGGGDLLLIAAIAGAVGLVATAIGAFFDPRQAAASWLVAFLFGASIAVGAVLALCSYHAAGAKWVVVTRRPLEVVASSALLFVPLAIPLFAATKLLFPWAGAPVAALDEHHRALLAHKAGWLNVPFFVGRGAVFVVIWAVVGLLLHAWSRRQDETLDAGWTLRLRLLSGGVLPLLGLTFTFAAFDWVMSLDPFWYSTIFGVYVFAGAFMAALAVHALLGAIMKAPELGGDLVRADHRQNLGNMLLSFVVFWAYIAFSQAMLIWIGNLPEEVEWYATRTAHGWGGFGLFLILAHFFFPFVALLFRFVKRSRALLASIAALTLLAHLVDLYWLVMPTFRPEHPAFHFTDFTALVGVTGCLTAFVVWRMRAGAPLPVGDPFLPESLRYAQP